MNLHCQVVLCEILFSLMSSNKIQQLTWSSLKLNLTKQKHTTGHQGEAYSIFFPNNMCMSEDTTYLIEQINEINIIRLSFKMALKNSWNMVAKDNTIIYSNEPNLLQNNEIHKFSFIGNR